MRWLPQNWSGSCSASSCEYALTCSPPTRDAPPSSNNHSKLHVWWMVNHHWWCMLVDQHVVSDFFKECLLVFGGNKRSMIQNRCAGLSKICPCKSLLCVDIWGIALFALTEIVTRENTYKLTVSILNAEKCKNTLASQALPKQGWVVVNLSPRRNWHALANCDWQQVDEAKCGDEAPYKEWIASPGMAGFFLSGQPARNNPRFPPPQGATPI